MRVETAKTHWDPRRKKPALPLTVALAVAEKWRKKKKILQSHWYTTLLLVPFCIITTWATLHAVHSYTLFFFFEISFLFLFYPIHLPFFGFTLFRGFYLCFLNVNACSFLMSLIFVCYNTKKCTKYDNFISSPAFSFSHSHSQTLTKTLQHSNPATYAKELNDISANDFHTNGDASFFFSPLCFFDDLCTNAPDGAWILFIRAVNNLNKTQNT